MFSIISALSNNGRGHAQQTGFTLKEGKFGINRELNYNLRGWDAMLESVEVLNDKLMAFHFCITNNTGKDQSTWVPKDYKSTIYITDNLGNKYPMLDFQGITKEPEKTRVRRGKTIRYSLMFPVFKEGAREFSFTEGKHIFKNIELVYGKETIAKNPVVPGGKVGMFQHGTLVTKTVTGELILASSPPEATHTHAGVDIVANCGTPIYAFADGRVKDLINNEKDNHFKALGYMVLIEHPPSLIGKTFYTLYLHMQNPPILSINEEVKASQEIGKVGDTGAAQGCHTHFEIRYFPTRFLEDPNWNDPWNIYGKGDQRSAKQFLENWREPLVFLLQIRPSEQKVITSTEQSQLDKVVFRIIGCPGFVANKRAEGTRAVRGDVPQDIDLSEDATTKEVLEKAVQFAQEKCPQKVTYGDITVRLYQKDRSGLDILMVNARNYYDANEITWPEYTNRPKQERLAKEEASRRAEEEKAEAEKIRKVNNKRLKLIGVDEKTGTRLSMIDKSGGLAGTDPCKGGYGALDVIGEVPPNFSMENDAMNQALVERVKDIFVPNACPKFKIGGSSILNLHLFKGEYTTRAEYAVSVQWTKHYPREPMKREYQNRVYERAKLEADIAAGVVRPLPTTKGEWLIFLGPDAKTGVKFWTTTTNLKIKCGYLYSGTKNIIGEVPSNLSLLDEKIAQSLVIAGSEILLDKCKGQAGWDLLNTVYVKLVPFDYKVRDMVYHSEFSPILIEGVAETIGGEMKTRNIRNFVLEAEQQKLKMAREREQQEKKREEVNKRLKEFVDRNGVKEWVSLKGLSANPFIYEGKIIGVVIRFHQMLSATQGLFGGEDFGLPAIVVSDIPRGLFTSEAKVVLAGRVLGNIETKLPLLGTMIVPHLKFIGVHLCKDWGCTDILPTEKK